MAALQWHKKKERITHDFSLVGCSLEKGIIMKLLFYGQLMQ